MKSCVAIAASTGALTNFAMTVLGDQRGDAIQANAANVVIGAWRSAAFVLLTLGVMRSCARGSVSASRAGWLLVGVVALDLWSVERQYWLFSARASELYADDAIIRYIKSQPQPGRVIALPLSDNMAPHDPFVAGDALMHHGVRGVLGYHGNELGRFQELYGKNEGYQSIANPNFWSLTNARYFYTNANGLPFQGAKLVAGPVRNAAGTMTYLYQLPGDHPVAWVAPLSVKLGDAATKATILNPLFDVRRVAIFDSASTINVKPVTSPVPDPVGFAVKVTRYDPGAIDLTLEGAAPAGSALVVSENFYPGWTATVDGQSAAIARADYTLIGVALPTGAKSVSLRFASAAYERGRLLTLGALAMSLALIGFGTFADRRSSSAFA